MKYVVVILTIALTILHHDFWFWSDHSVVLGFLPVGLAWHIGISLAAAAVGWLAVIYCWPRELEDESDSNTGETADGEMTE